MSKKKPLESRVFTLEQVRERTSEANYAGQIRERNRILRKLIELDVSVNVIDELFNEPEIRKKGYTADFIREEKAEYWQKQMEEKQ